jgi:hypothetical protein
MFAFTKPFEDAAWIELRRGGRILLRLAALKINDYHARIQISTILYFIG